MLSIDVVRFLASVSVAYYHLGFKAFSARSDELYQFTTHHLGYDGQFRLSSFGWIGVQIFFVISGFVIAFSLGAGAGPRPYARRRILRLAPAVWIIVPICLAIAVVCFGDPVATSTLAAARTAAFLPLGPWLLGQFWTLPIEIAFYVGVGVLIGLGRTDQLERFGWALAAISAAYWLGDAYFHFGPRGQRIVQLALLQHGIFFAIGIVLYNAAANGLTTARMIFLAACCVPAFLQIGWAAQWEMPTVEPVERTCVSFAIWLAATFMLLSATQAAATQAASTPNAPRLAAVVRLMGLATYPLYLLHYHLGGVILIAVLSVGAPPAVAIAIALVASIAAAACIAHYGEPPLRAGLSRILGAIGLGTAPQAAAVGSTP